MLTKQPMKYRRLVWAAAICCVIIALSVAIFVWTRPFHRLRQALPRSATDIHDAVEDLFPDGNYFLKAKLSREKFGAYVARVGLHPMGPSLGANNFNGPFDRSLAWWDPLPDAEEEFVREDPQAREQIYAKYGKGYLYLKSVSY